MISFVFFQFCCSHVRKLSVNANCFFLDEFDPNPVRLKMSYNVSCVYHSAERSLFIKPLKGKKAMVQHIQVDFNQKCVHN